VVSIGTMSYYVYGTGISYLQYLQAKSFVDDISSTGRGISLEVSRQTRELIASDEALARDNIRVIKDHHHEHMAAIDASADRISGGLERISDGLGRLSQDVHASSERIIGALDTGFDRLSVDLQSIESGLSELNATFHWGFSEMIAGIGHMSDLLSELIKIAKTPVQTVAFNHFEIARDAFRQRLYRECLEELSKAIFGDHASPGYKLEWRFHQLVGTIRLGFADMSPEDLHELQDLAQAESSFLLAARYARTDYPNEAALAFLAAGWAAYCLGKMTEALTQTEQAFVIDPQLGEAFFQVAKVRMACGQVDAALPTLRQAIEIDRGYALKAAADGDFQKYEERLREFLEALRQEKCQQALGRARIALDAAEETFDTLELSREPSGEERDPDIFWLREFLTTVHQLPLLDLIDAVPKLDASIAAVKGKLAILRKAQPLSRARMALNAVEKFDALELSQEPSDEERDPDICWLREFLTTAYQLPLVDLIDAVPKLDASIAAVEGKLAFLRKAVQRARATLAALQFWRENSANAAGNIHLRRLLDFFSPGSTQPLSAVLAAAKQFDASLASLEGEATNSAILLTQSIGQISYQQQFEADESYQEEVGIWPGPFFRKLVGRLQTKVRTVTRTRAVTLTQISDDIRILWGERGKQLVTLEFCQIPPGQFHMGEQGRQHEVILTTGYFMGKYPITQAQWQAVMGTNPSRFNGDSRMPVECVSWPDCQTLITRLNDLVGKNLYHLPTEAEWEYACRAGCEADYYWGESERYPLESSRYAWCGGNSGGQTHPVGILGANRWGLHDMIGNVWEWYQDIFDDYPSATVTDPCVTRGSTNAHVYRGGSIADSVTDCRVSTRLWGGARIMGVRLARRIL
jgi:formylglycine-generating enzyme required for sulfatase activity